MRPKTTKSNRTITLLPPVRKYLDQIRPLHVRPDDYILKNRHGDPIDQDGFAARHFWPALRALNIRHRDFYATRDTFISVMLMHGEPSKRVADYCGTSSAMIEGSYGKWIGGNQGFGEAALKAAKPKLHRNLARRARLKLSKCSRLEWRRGGDSNPRYPY